MENSSLSVLPEMNEIWQQTLNWQPSIEQQAQFQQLYEAIVVGNQKLNLTRITAPEEFWEKHLWDSLRGIISLLPTNFVGTHRCAPLQKIIDIGTGAGFPGIPVAIALPNTKVTLLDSTQKKIAFLNSLIAEMNIQNARTLVGRAENLNQQSQQYQKYDLALVRAVAAADICANYALPFLKSDGVAILYRGNWTTEEETNLIQAAQTLGAKVENIEKFTTPLSHSTRHCIYLRRELRNQFPN